MKPFVTYRPARVADAPLLAAMNQHLIQDEGHSNPMTVPELVSRMKQWLRREYRGVLFERGGEVVGYAVYRLDVGSIYLRQFFIGRKYRRQGIGRAAMQILLSELFPPRTRVTVDVLHHNHAAHEFWKAIGFHDYAVTLEMRRS